MSARVNCCLEATMTSRSILAALVVTAFASVAAAQDARTTIAAASKARAPTGPSRFITRRTTGWWTSPS